MMVYFVWTDNLCAQNHRANEAIAVPSNLEDSTRKPNPVHEREQIRNEGRVHARLEKHESYGLMTRQTKFLMTH
jgi:hypothetical protein